MFFSQTNPNDFEVHFRDPAGVVKVEGQISITGDIHADLSFANMVKIQDGAAYPTESVQNECRSDVTGQGSYDSSPSNTITTPQSCAQNFVMSPRFWLETPAFQVSPATNNSFLDWPNVQNSQFYQDNNSLMNIVKVSAQYADGVFPNDFNRMGIKHGKIGDLVFPAP